MTSNYTESNRLVYISDAAIPSREANSIQTMEMCGAFAQIGLDVTLLVPDRSDRINRNVWEFYDIDSTFEIKRVPWQPGERYLFSLLVQRYLRSVDPYYVYTRFVPPGFFAALLGYRTIFELHSPYSEEPWPIPRMFKLLVRFGLLERVVVISDALRKHLLGSYSQLSDGDIIVAHDAARPLDEIEPILPSSNRLRVGYVGHLYEGKGMKLITELVKMCPWADFHIIGGRDTEITEWKNQLERDEHVKFHGFVPPSEVSRYQISMDVLLAPYQREVFGASGERDISRWMSPLKLFEYMAAGKLILASDLPAIREILDSGENAILLAPDEPSQWVDWLERIDEERDLITEFGRKAQIKQKKEYTYAARARNILRNISS